MRYMIFGIRPPGTMALPRQRLILPGSPGHRRSIATHSSTHWRKWGLPRTSWRCRWRMSPCSSYPVAGRLTWSWAMRQAWDNGPPC
jgi:hypothetical protein